MITNVADHPFALSTILIVDDDADVGQAVTDLLGQEGCRVELAQTGHEAMTKVSQNHYDTVVLDIGLPDIDGVSVLDSIVTHQPSLPVVILTVRTSLENTVGPIGKRGAFAYITKPYNRDELKAAIRRALDTNRRAHNNNELVSALSSLDHHRSRRLLETARVIPWESDYETGRVTYIGPQVGNLLGYSPDEWYRDQFWETHVHPEDRSWVTAFCRESATHQSEYELEYRMLAKDGATVWIHDLVSVTPDTSGKPISLQGFMIDVTERKQMQEMLERSYTEAKGILAHLPFLITLVDMDQRIVYANPPACQHLEHEGNTLAGRLLSDLFTLTPSQWNRLIRMYMSETTNPPLESEESEFVKDERVFRYHPFSVPFHPCGQRYLGLAIWEITEHKQLQDKLIQTEKLSGLGTLVSGLAHEISNPLQAIVGMAELISDEHDLIAVKELAFELSRIARHSANVLRDFMAYARSSANAPPVEIDLNEQLTEAVKMVKRGPYFGSVEVMLDFQPVPPMSARRAEIEQIFVNLISNAVQAMDGKGSLKLSTYVNGSMITAVVHDTGPGIPRSMLEKIFDPFFTTKSQGKGTGLGLSIVQKIVTKYGGKITVNSEQGQGSTFTVQFPFDPPLLQA